VRKIFLSSMVLAATMFANETNYLEAGVGLWYMQWEQSDKAPSNIVDKPIDNKFTIENSFAQELSLTGKYKYIKSTLKYFSSEGSDAVGSKKSKVTDIFANFGFDSKNIQTIYTYTKSTTSGNAVGYDKGTGNDSYIEFNTDLTLHNLTFYPGWFLKKYVGFGTQYIKYDLPQSIYLMKNGSEIFRAVDPNVSWEATYATIELTNIHKIAGKEGWNPYFFLTGGYSLNIKATSRVATDAGYSDIFNGDKGYFYKGDVGIRYNMKKYLGFALGYKYSTYTFETKSNDGEIYANAETKLSGVYTRLYIRY